MISLPHFLLLSTLLTTLSLTACGTLTGIPSHGGGKRFAIEQELVSASSRATVKNMDLSALKGKKVALYVSTIGHEGSGTMMGGRYSIDALIRGEYTNLPTTRTAHTYPTYQTLAETQSGDITGITKSQSVLNAPSYSTTNNSGHGERSNIGLNINGMGDYRNETMFANPEDGSFLSNLIHTMFFLRGIEIVPNQQADTHVFVNVDVFGTIRSRTEAHIYNAETLKAQTKLEYFAIDKAQNSLLIRPQTSSYEATYKEKYAFWTGPYRVKKTVQPADPLMVDFADVMPY